MSQNPDTVSDPSSDPATEGERPETEQEQTGPPSDSLDHSRDTDVFESDPNADSPEGLTGGMGVSSERVGAARGTTEQVTYAANETHHPTPSPDASSEQSSDPSAGEDVRPEQPVLKQHPAEDPAKRGPAAYYG